MIPHATLTTKPQLRHPQETLLKIQQIICDADTPIHNNASWVTTDVAGHSPPPAPQPSTLGTIPLYNSGSASIPGTFTALTDAASYNSGEELDYKDKCEVAFYSHRSKSNNGAGVYLSPSPSSCHVCTKPWSENGVFVEPIIKELDPAIASLILPNSKPFCRPSYSKPRGIHTINLPKIVLGLLQNPPAHSISVHNAKLVP
jgi:hypothetical protein